MQNHVDPNGLSVFDLDHDPFGPSKPIDFDLWIAAARRQAGVVMAATAAAVLLGAAYALTATPLYTATTNLLIDSRKDKTALAASIADLTFDTGAIDSQVEVLKSEKIALAVIAARKRAGDADFVADKGSWLGALLDVRGWFASSESSSAEGTAREERAEIERLKSRLDVRRIARSYVLAISYTSADPNKAAAIANAFAEAYANEQLDARFEATRRAAQWMQARLGELKQQSIASDLAIQRYKASHGIVVTGGDRPGLMSDQQLTELNAEIVAAQGDTARAEARFKQIEELLRSGRIGAAVPDSLANPVVNDLRAKYLAASKTEAQLEAKLGAGHAQVVQLRREMSEYDRLIHEELKRIAESYRSEAEVARAKEQSLSASMSRLVGQSAATNETLVELRELQREADAYRALYETFMQRYQDTLQRESFPETESRVITAATPPASPSAPKRGVILGLCLMAGLGAGGALGALREYRDRVFRVAAHVREELGLDFLGLLETLEPDAWAVSAPHDDPRCLRVDRAIQRYSLDHPLSGFTESLRAAKVAADHALGERQPKVVGVISALPNEGKSTVSKNFASHLAHLGAATLLIDCDLRGPGLTTSLAGHAEAGLLEALLRRAPLENYLLVEPESGLRFLPAVMKTRIVHSSETMASPAMRDMLADAGQTFDYIVVDLPPLGLVVDVRAASALFDAFIFVAEWGRTPRPMVQTLFADDEALRGKCVGVLYNKVDLKRVNQYERYGSRDYRYPQYKYYGQREEV